MIKLILIALLALLAGCAGLTDMTSLDPTHYPLSVRNGDIVDKYIYDQTYVPISPMYRRIFGRDY